MNLPQPVAEVPLPDAPQAKAFIEACQECEIQLATAKKQAAISTLQTNALKLVRPLAGIVVLQAPVSIYF